MATWLDGTERGTQAGEMRLGKYLFNILVAIDQFGSAITFGDPDETLSSRYGKLKRKHGGTIPWRYPVSKSIDWMLDKIDPGHSIDSIEEDEGKNSLDKRGQGD